MKDEFESKDDSLSNSMYASADISSPKIADERKEVEILKTKECEESLKQSLEFSTLDVTPGSTDVGGEMPTNSSCVSIDDQNIENVNQENNFLSIVDRIKNDITALRTLSKTGNQTSTQLNHAMDTNFVTDPKDEAFGSSKTNSIDQMELDHKQTGIKVALDRVYREKSVGCEIQVPKELSSHLIHLSSANISEDLRRSCSNIVARASEKEMSKEYLLKRLGDLLAQEKKQLNEDLLRRKQQLKETRNVQAKELNALDKQHKEELRKLRNTQTQNISNLESNYLDQVEYMKKEIEFLENEKINMESPQDIISNYLQPSRPSELESELECCNCNLICKPPCKIYQCPEGDIFCQNCKNETDKLEECPKCGIGLTGQLSRNKGLEKIAAKYFK